MLYEIIIKEIHVKKTSETTRAMAQAFHANTILYMYFYHLEANNTRPDQTALKRAVGSGFILFAIYAIKIHHGSIPKPMSFVLNAENEHTVQAFS